MNVNEMQQKAINHLNGPMLVLAGPGSGKTTVIIHRVQNLIKNNVLDKDILVITFSKSAAVEMKERYESSFETNRVSFSTFHALFFRIIRRQYNYNLENILKEEEKKEIIGHIIKKENIFVTQGEDFIIELINEISLVKNELINVQDYNSKNIIKDDFRKLYIQYEEIKEKNNKIDFDDMLVKCYNLLLENEDVLNFWRRIYKYILVDEFQDINKVQYEVLKMLSKPLCNLFVVGDDDQSIYRFRGASPWFLLNFSKDFENTKKVILEINYRSTDNIINLANAVIKGNKNRFSKDIKGTNKKGNQPIIITSKDIKSEADIISSKILEFRKKISYNDIVVIYRTNIQSRAFIDIFMNKNIPFQVKEVTSSIYNHFLMKDLVSYMTLSLDRDNDLALKRIINKPNRYISNALLNDYSTSKYSLLNNLKKNKSLQTWQKNRIEEIVFILDAIGRRNPYEAIRYIRVGANYNDYIKDYASYRKINSKALYEILDEIQESAKGYNTLEEYLDHIETAIEAEKQQKFKKNEPKDGVTLTTIHSVKGLEFNTVFVAGAVDGVIPYEKAKHIDDIEEERRLFYVALTRAKENLYISNMETRYDEDCDITRFLNKN